MTSVAVPGTGLDVKLQTQVGQPYDPEVVEKDVRYLWNLGRFEDVRVVTAEQDGGVAVTFRTAITPNRMVREVRIEPNSFGIQLKVPDHAMMTDLRAHSVAMEAKKQLTQMGYPNAHVDYVLKPVGESLVDLKLNVTTGQDVSVKRVLFEGDDSMRKKLHDLNSHRILFVKLDAPFSQEAMDSDMARVRSGYFEKGFYEADVHPGPVTITGKKAEVTIVANPGPQYPVEKNLCSNLYIERRQAQRDGILDFAARLDVEHLEDGPSISLGPKYRVGRIEFTGNHHFSDAFVRSNFLIEEGAVMDEHLLRKSLARLNRANVFESIDPKNVVVDPHENTGLADITVHLHERKSGSWNISGPVGPMSLAGPLEASIATRLPAWGRGLLELSTYSLSLSVMAVSNPLVPILNAPKAFTPILALQRPFTPGGSWASGLLFAPQLGWQDTVLSYVTTQMQQRLVPLVQGDRGLETELNVTIARPEGDAPMFCSPPKPRYSWIRIPAGMALQFLGTLPSI